MVVSPLAFDSGGILHPLTRTDDSAEIQRMMLATDQVGATKV
jgi:hypothetical protein